MKDSLKNITLGITAHVDSGKTTLSEAMLYTSGKITKFGRVDNKNSFLDTNSIERDRGITIFSHCAEFSFGNTCITLLDTPGHVDFSAETERTMCVLDYAVLVISGTDGVQSHTSTLWKLLEKYNVPVFIFVNKMDLNNADKKYVLEKIKKHLSPFCTDFTEGDIYENTASCCEELIEKYLNDGELSENDIVSAVAERKVFPCFFGSALKMQGIEEFISALDRFTREPQRSSEFGAKVYKISYDSKGARLTHLKVMGGVLNVRDEISYTDRDGKPVCEKISSLRFYSGEKFSVSKEAPAGKICAVTGLERTFAGQGIGIIQDSKKSLLEPVMTYQIKTREDKNIHDVLKDMRKLEDQDPQLQVVWNEQKREIHMQLMGAVQIEVLSRVIHDKFGYNVDFVNGAVSYRETVRTAVEGIGHYEPLKHYAEVHLLIEPLPRNSGMKFETSLSEDVLNRNWQRLILTHLEEKTHIGVLTGSPVTDMKITLVNGKAHIKHTEGGDFRQAVYRAVRQGLRSTESILLEPYYQYEMEIPSECTGRAISDLQRMSAEFDAPETLGENTVIRGFAPVSEINEYQSEIVSYTRGKGKITYLNAGYRECHNAEEVIQCINYDCDSDIDNSADSVFCSHGGGYLVKWNEVPLKMHLPSYFAPVQTHETSETVRKSFSPDVNDDELMKIFEKTYGKINRDPRNMFKREKTPTEYDKPVKLPDYQGNYLLVDGYNIIFAWEELKKISEKSLDSARAELINMMCSYQGYTGVELILVFDAYRVKGRHREVEKYFNINIVYTNEAETADTYIERVTHELSKKYRVKVATSDGAEQLIIFGNGAGRISASEFHQKVKEAQKAMQEYIENP